MSVFYSFLSVLIVLALYILFLGGMQANATASHGASGESVQIIVTGWLLAGLIVVSSTSVPMILLSRMVSDMEREIFNDFLVAPISRRQIMSGYVAAATLVGFVSTLLLYAVGEVYLLWLGASLPSLASMLKLVLLMLVAVAVSATMLFVLISLIRTENSVGALNSIVGTLIGFLAGIYVPFGLLSDSVKLVSLLFPHTHLTSVMRQLILDDGAVPTLAQQSVEGLVEYRANYGIDLYFNDALLPPLLSVIYCLLAGLFFFILAVALFRRTRSN